MLDKIKPLKMIRRLKYFRELRKKHFGKNVLILGAGPSLKKINQDQIKFLQEEGNFCVVVLKQAALYYEDFDIAIANECREVKIEKNANKIQDLIGISSPKMSLDWDIVLPILTYKWSLTILRRPALCFWNPLYNPFRPWGVGVFFELAIFLPIIFKSKIMVTVGFDMANTIENPFNHFYGTITNDIIDDGLINEIKLIPSATAKINDQMKRLGVEVFSLTVPDSPISFEKFHDFNSLHKKIANILNGRTILKYLG